MTIVTENTNGENGIGQGDFYDTEVLKFDRAVYGNDWLHL